MFFVSGPTLKKNTSKKIFKEKIIVWAETNVVHRLNQQQAYVAYVKHWNQSHIWKWAVSVPSFKVVLDSWR